MAIVSCQRELQISRMIFEHTEFLMAVEVLDEMLHVYVKAGESS